MSAQNDNDLALLRLHAKVMSLETLCLCLFMNDPEKDAVIATFSEMKERFTAKALNDSELLDSVPAEMDAAHEHVLSVIRALR